MKKEKDVREAAREGYSNPIGVGSCFNSIIYIEVILICKKKKKTLIMKKLKRMFPNMIYGVKIQWLKEMCLNSLTIKLILMK